MKARILLVAMLALVSVSATAAPLPSWNEGPVRDGILDFVARVTDPAGGDFVPEPERVAVFDNDGTLWGEQPVYFQSMYILDLVLEQAPDHPDWKTTQPFQAVLEGDIKGALGGGTPAILALAKGTHLEISPEEFQADVRDWLKTARHPRFDQPYTSLVYQPMLELLEYLEANGFQNFIVSGGGIDFLRAWAEEVYGIPPERVVGSSLTTELEMHDGVPVLVRRAEINFIDDKAEKPVGINQHIGRRPILAFGNSDGDHQMLQWTAAGEGPRFLGLVRHTDGDREYAYDRNSHIGKLDKALDEAMEKGWTVVDMKKDWKVVFPFEMK